MRPVWPSIPALTGWGIVLADLDLDGHLDLLTTNGHIRVAARATSSLREPADSLAQFGEWPVRQCYRQHGAYFKNLHMGRGLAAGDLDSDGDVDFVVVHHHKPSVVLWNESPRKGSYLIATLQGARGNRDAIGARVFAQVGPQFVRTIDGGGSYISSSDLRVHFGLGDAKRIDRLEIHWPSGKVEVKSDVPVNQVVLYVEGASSSARPE